MTKQQIKVRFSDLTEFFLFLYYAPRLRKFSLNPARGIILPAAIVLLYTILGGFLAVSLIASTGLPTYAIIHAGGWSHIGAVVLQFDEGFLNPTALSFGVLAGFPGIGLGSPGNPHILVRYMSIKDPKQFRLTAIVGTVWNILVSLLKIKSA